jgi:hypothetical protein
MHASFGNAFTAAVNHGPAPGMQLRAKPFQTSTTSGAERFWIHVILDSLHPQFELWHGLVEVRADELFRKQAPDMWYGRFVQVQIAQLRREPRGVITNIIYPTPHTGFRKSTGEDRVEVLGSRVHHVAGFVVHDHTWERRPTVSYFHPFQDTGQDIPDKLG